MADLVSPFKVGTTFSALGTTLSTMVFGSTALTPAVIGAVTTTTETLTAVGVAVGSLVMVHCLTDAGNTIWWIKSATCTAANQIALKLSSDTGATPGACVFFWMAITS